MALSRKYFSTLTLIAALLALAAQARALKSVPDPLAPPASIVISGNVSKLLFATFFSPLILLIQARFTVLAESLIRLEYSSDGSFKALLALPKNN